MAQILLIKTETVRDGLQYLGDVVGIFEDSHQFSDHELTVFNVLTVAGSRLDVEAKFDQIKPEVADAYLWESDGEYHWTIPDEGNVLNTREVARPEGNNKWYLLENRFKFPINVDMLTPEEKQVLETVDINHPSVDAFIKKIAKNVFALPGNDVEVRELRNTEPPE